MNTFKSAYNDFKVAYDLTGDYIADNEAWAAYVDGLVKSGVLSHLHWKYLPNLQEIETWGDAVTDASYFLDMLGITMVFEREEDQGEDLWTVPYDVTVTRGDKKVTLGFQMYQTGEGLPTRESAMYWFLEGYDPDVTCLKDLEDYGYDLTDPEDKETAQEVFDSITRDQKNVELLFSEEEIPFLIRIFVEH